MQNILKTEEEIERKWLLRNNPFYFSDDFTPNDILYITQWYVLIDGVNRRIRKTVSSDNIPEWIMIHKESVSPGVNNEHHYPITEEEANLYIKSAIKQITKKRYIKHFDGFKIEVDQFESIHLIMMEIEIPSIDFKFDMPSEVISHIICEVTGQKAFDNFNLAYSNDKS